MDKPLVSVVTTVYNTEKYVERCFESIMNQTYDNIEFIIIDNASDGNIKEIVKKYIDMYPEKKIKMYTITENKGLFNGRLEGINKASGDYIAFIDSDDRVSLDYYRVLLNEALEKKADMVASDVILEYSDSSMMYENFSPYHLHNVDLINEEIKDTFWKQEGECYYWHLVWNKLYSKELINQALPLLNKMTKKIIMCDDMAFSTVLFNFAKHFVSNNMVSYYYYKRNDAYTTKVDRVDLFESNIENVGDVFCYMEDIQKICGLEKYEVNLKRWKERYKRIWIENIKKSKLLTIEKNKLLRIDILKAFGNKDYNESFNEDNVYQLVTPYYPYIEEYVKEIKNSKIKVISFDIFDTLIIRPFEEPEDLFKLMDYYAKKELNMLMIPDFVKIRKYSEQYTRIKEKQEKNNDEIDLDSIYINMSKIFGYSEDVCNRLKKKEIELEISLCQKRKLGFYLYSLAKALGKKIVFVSDMYLPLSIIKEILKKNGIIVEEKSVYLSSEYKLTKYNGDLFDIVLKNEIIKKNEIIHLGDNYHSDIEVAEKRGLKALHLPKISEVWLSSTPNIYTNNFFYKCFIDNSQMMANSCNLFLSSRCAYSIVANHLYDNPFTNYNIDTFFNSNPYDMGYALMGPFLLGVSHWLYENAKKMKYECIHFIARDGFLIKQAFEILQPYFGDYQFKVNYLHVSRKALAPLMINQVNDFDNLDIVLDYTKHSPKSLILLFGDILDNKNVQEICESYEWKYDKKFTSLDEYIKFINIIKRKAYSDEKNRKYRETIKNYFDRIIGNHDCFFDVGYSGRTESILKSLIGKKIDTFYINTTTQVGMDNSYTNDFYINSFYRHLPILSGPVREFLMSEISPSCIKLQVKNNTVDIVYDDNNLDYKQQYVLSLFQRGAIEYINNFSDLFRNTIRSMSFREADLAWPLDYFFRNASKKDIAAFDCFEFEDDLFLGNKQKITDYWIKNVVPTYDENDSQLYEELSRIKKSLSYKIGRIATWFPRKVRKVVVRGLYKMKKQ